MSKFKLTTLIHKDITDEQCQEPGFLSLLALLPQLYAAHLRPQAWTEEMGVRTTLQDDMLFTGSEHYADFHEEFRTAARMELHLYPGREGTLNGDIELCKGRDRAYFLLFVYDFATGKATTGIRLSDC